MRDELLGLKPKDYDVATDAPPERVRELFTKHASGRRGVRRDPRATWRGVRSKSRHSAPTARYLDGRRPAQVHFTTAEEDAKRRDFTINGLFLDPIEDRVIDFVGGQEDLKSKMPPRDRRAGSSF